MKATVTRLIAEIESNKGTTNWGKCLLTNECKLTNTNRYHFVGNYAPQDSEYEVTGSKKGIYLVSKNKNERYLLSANAMPFIDFRD